MPNRHEEQSEVHRVNRWEHADVTERDALSVIADDIGKVSLQQDTGRLEYLADAVPTWVEINNRIVYRNIASHTDTTWYSLFTDGAAEQLLVEPDQAWAVKVLVIGLTSGAAERWAYEINGMVVNDGGTTTVVSGTPDVISESDAAYDVQLVPDDTNDGIEIQVRRNGGSDYDINWRALVMVVKETYA
jgi:hypothetical protein